MSDKIFDGYVEINVDNIAEKGDKDHDKLINREIEVRED